jgi:hypothetical protein
VTGGIITKLPLTWRKFAIALKHKRQKISVEDLLAGLDVEEKAWAKDAPPRAPEGQSSANVMQQAGKNKQKANQTTQFKKKKMNMDEVVCFVCGETAHFTKKCKNRKGKKNQRGINLPTLLLTILANLGTIIHYLVYFLYVNLMIGG